METIQINFAKTCFVEVKTFRSHPDHEAIYATFLEDKLLSVITSEGAIDFDFYDGHILVGNFLSTVNEDNFIPRRI